MNAIIFDLDDTLYRERRWVLSGFSALAQHLEQRQRLDRRVVFRLLVGAVRAGRRHDALQRLCRHFDLSLELIPDFVKIVRAHTPRLRLGAETRNVLTQLRPTWRLAVLTNGLPAVQERKVDALDLRPMVDVVVYANNYGNGKPEPRPFLEAAAHLGADPSRCVFVGDDPWCDVHGARRVGMRTVRLIRHPRGENRRTGPEADVVIEHLAEVADVAALLMNEERHHADDN